MHTLQEFMHQTKGLAYVLGAVVLVGFIAFWLFLTERQPRE